MKFKSLAGLTHAQPLPSNWKALKARVLSRDDGVCYVCGLPGADQVDHVVPASQGGTDEESNLAAIHHDPCHMRKISLEAAAGRSKAFAPGGPKSQRRRAARHPGLLEAGGR